MKRTAIVTLAGTSSRFSRSVGRECHKSLFREQLQDDSLLDWQLSLLKRSGFSRIVLVGGYKLDELEAQVKSRYADWPITLVSNNHYSDWGSCYSLCLGIDAVPENSTSVVFLEGDLLFDYVAFSELLSVEDDAITATKSIVDARTSVAFYIAKSGRLQYVYDTAHTSLKIDEPFTRIGNSGQVWQFVDVKRLKDCSSRCGEKEWRGTNLLPIMDYYSTVDGNAIRICAFDKWFNCNTISDYRAMRAYVKGQ